MMKQFGVGIGVAILIDATVIRALLVPASIKLIWVWNWWAPRPLGRFRERFGLRAEGSTGPDRGGLGRRMNPAWSGHATDEAAGTHKRCRRLLPCTC
jgi:RND superfamily putative drug exporter